MSELYIINARGEKEPFSFRKVYRSARRVGASKSLAQKIAKTIQEEVYPGMETRKIFKRVKDLLEKSKPQSALKFSLKQAMEKLGPTGFPFEKFVGEILAADDFKVQFNQHIRGRCATHEIDFLAQNEKMVYIGECKYHRRRGERVDLGVGLLHGARFLDVEKKSPKRFKNKQLRSMLATNTKFTSDAVRYCRCVGIKLLGWNRPRGRGLEYLIDTKKLYPITILPSFKGRLVEVFSAKKMMLAKDLLKESPIRIVRRLNLSRHHLDPLIKEAKILLE